MKIRSARFGTYILGAVLLLCLLVVLPGSRIVAQATSEQGSGNNLKISPLRTDLTLRPGESREVSVYVENLDSKPILLKPIENDFIAGDDESGTAAIILGENQYAPTHSLKRFMTPLDNITVGAGERKEVRVPIAVPSDAQSGGYFGAIRFAPANEDGSENVNVSSSVASLILLTVPGNLIESLQLTDFNVVQNGENASRLASPDNVSVVVRLENKGNVQVAPFGNLSVLKGDEVIYSTEVNDTKPAGVVLPDSARKYDIPVENLGSFGKYTFKATLGYGTEGSGNTIEFERSIWIVPTTYIFGAIGAVVVLIIAGTFIVIGLRSYKKKILRSARRR